VRSPQALCAAIACDARALPACLQLAHALAGVCRWQEIAHSAGNSKRYTGRICAGIGAKGRHAQGHETQRREAVELRNLGPFHLAFLRRSVARPRVFSHPSVLASQPLSRAPLAGQRRPPSPGPCRGREARTLA
jgi:hypothetical protein